MDSNVKQNLKFFGGCTITPKPAKESSSPPPETSMKQNVGLEEEGTITGGRGITLSSAQPGRRVYTVLAPPADYKTGAEGSVMLSASRHKYCGGPNENTHESNKDGEGEEEVEDNDGGRGETVVDGAAQGTDSNPGDTTMPLTPMEEGVWLSKKRRKLKRKHHKQKLLSLGLAHRLQAGSSVVVEGLLSLSTGTFPPAVLAQLHTLKLLVQQQDTARMAKALQELQNSSIMSPGNAEEENRLQSKPVISSNNRL
ncbi:unnamed protein product [Coregonus sp. 'balchen']|nr:unnamed protein product [Coregonus sp. 'balchen']